MEDGHGRKKETVPWMALGSERPGVTGTQMNGFFNTCDRTEDTFVSSSPGAHVS